MFAMVRQFCAMFTTLFAAGEHSCKALEHLSVVAEENAGAYRDISTMDRKINMLKLKAKHEAQLPALEE